ncbi:MAG: Unknown protein [uncultured Aureispira sp.]|uniref:Uncharacterized protein n=1 Tax=uncultured Aureispira sp. TaxID=1331704 RepID=A0A6S6SYL8_9BACT|nr:MAG: Unknown protein [uncultured Aureispira sp.]
MVKSIHIQNFRCFEDFQLDGFGRVEIACHFMNVDGQGELETVLRAIKTKESPHADCLNTWRD